MTTYNTLVTGVGGQGVLFISEILGMAALKEGLDVRVAEIHGMAQRGGSVTCNVRMGKRVYSPTITKGTADLIIGLEPLEVLRLLGYAHDETIVALNMNPIVPSSATSVPCLRSLGPPVKWIYVPCDSNLNLWNLP